MVVQVQYYGCKWLHTAQIIKYTDNHTKKYNNMWKFHKKARDISD